MRKLKLFLCIAYMVLSIVCTITLAVTLFLECYYIPQLTLLIQGVGFAFVSGVYFDA